MFTEGRVTEDSYLLFWHRHFRDSVLITVDSFHGTPVALVDRAVRAKREEIELARRGRGKSHDEVWCIFDRDDHPNVPQALDKAAANGIGVVLSDPCIELWFMLHFLDQTAYLDRVEAQRSSLGLLGCGKALTLPALIELASRYDDARERARRLDTKHAGDGSARHTNPSSNMWQLIDRIRAN